MQNLTTYGPGDSATWGPCTDPRDPRWDDDREPSDSHRADAADELLADAWTTSDWLACKVMQPEGGTTDVRGFEHLDMSEATVDQLWTLMLTGSDAQCLHARMELKDRILRDERTWINDRAMELMADSMNDDPYSDDPHHWY
jgi:hypothetical protein